MSATTFIRDHTIRDNKLPHQDECPICLDTYTTEQCLRITHIPLCNHHIGARCLDEMLRSHPHEEKKCPLCRAIWIPARSLLFPPHQQSLGTSRRMANMFAGLDGIGADIGANQQIGAPPAQQQQLGPRRRRLQPAAIELPESMAMQSVQRQRSPIVIDSDSDEPDYDTQVQNFQEFRRDIADIRSRAQMGRRSRKRRAADRETAGGRKKEDGDGGAVAAAANEGGLNSGSNIDNAIAATGLDRTNTVAGWAGGTTTPGTRALNRFLNNRSRNPFRPAENTAPTSDLLEQQEQQQQQLQQQRRSDRRRRLEFEQPTSPSGNNASATRPTTPPPFHLSPNRQDTPIDVDMTADELVELPAVQSTHARETDNSRQLDRREAQLNRREQALIARQTALARRDEAIQERERSANDMLLVVRRQREELEEMTTRHKEEIDELLNQVN